MTTNAPPVLSEGPVDAPPPDYVSYFEERTSGLASQFKKGYRTSEFWTALATVGTVLLNAVLDLGLDSESIVALVGTNASYILGRSFLKGKRVQAMTY